MSDKPYLKPGQLCLGRRKIPVSVVIFERIYDSGQPKIEEGIYAELTQSTILMYLGEFINEDFFYDGEPGDVFLMNDKYLHLAKRNIESYVVPADNNNNNNSD